MSESTALKVAKMEKDIDYIKTELTETKEIIKTFIEKADEKYASKVTERIVYGMVSLILTAVAGAVIYLVVV